MPLTNRDRVLTRKEGFVVCSVCEQSYPVGQYKLHKMQPWHVEHLSSSRLEAWSTRHTQIQTERRKLACMSYGSGMSMADIGNMLGVSRQRIHQILLQEGVHHPRSAEKRTKTCFIDGQDFQLWKEHSEGVAHKTAEVVIVGHLRTSPHTKRKGNKW
jgi:hypothetical protein